MCSPRRKLQHIQFERRHPPTFANNTVTANVGPMAVNAEASISVTVTVQAGTGGTRTEQYGDCYFDDQRFDPVE